MQAPVRIVPYDASWPARFAEKHEALARVLAPWLVGPIEHIGSTAVPGLAAKPVIDIMAAVDTLDASSRRTRCARITCTWCPSAARSGTTGSRSATICAAIRPSPPSTPRSSELAAKHEHDRSAYTDAKEPFVRKVLALAGRERSRNGATGP